MPHHKHRILIQPDTVLTSKHSVLKPRCSYPTSANEVHDNHVVFQKLRPGRPDQARLANAFQVAHLFLGPKFHFFTRVALAVTFSEAELA